MDRYWQIDVFKVCYHQYGIAEIPGIPGHSIEWDDILFYHENPNRWQLLGGTSICESSLQAISSSTKDYRCDRRQCILQVCGWWWCSFFFFLSYHRYLSEQRTTFINIFLGRGKRAKVSEVRGYSQHHLLLAYCCWRGRERENKKTRQGIDVCTIWSELSSSDVVLARYYNSSSDFLIESQ